MTERAKHRYAEPAWTDAEVALLIDKWHGPYKSMTTIADEMTRECRRQITKDAIAGRIDRLKKKGLVTGRPSPIAIDSPTRARTGKIRHTTGPQTPRPAPHPVIAKPPKREGNIPDEPRHRSQPRALPPVARQRPGAVEPCCFVTSEGKPWRYCDAPSLAGKVYCAEHHEMSYVRLPRKERDPSDAHVRNYQRF